MNGSDIDVAVIGAGVVGLAIGRALAGRNLTVAVLEKNVKPGAETSSRHSGVIHAGIYYPTGSLKAQLCVSGRQMLYDFCLQRNVAHARIGKLIVAVDQAEIQALETLRDQGLDNGVDGLEMITADQARAREPNIKVAAAMVSHSTGIVDSDQLIPALERDLTDNGGSLLIGQQVTGLERIDYGWRVSVTPSRGEPNSFTAARVINAAGLHADKIARMAGVDDFSIHWCKGDYFWTPKKLISGLVYPLPEAGLKGLGVHATVDLAGRLRFGPDTAYVDELTYHVNEVKAVDFARAIGRYLPAITTHDLMPDTAGMRPKLVGPEGGWADFRITEDKPGLINLAGIESPGLTSCLAIGKHVADMVC